MWTKIKLGLIWFVIGLIVGGLLCGIYVYHNSKPASTVRTITKELRDDNRAIGEAAKQLQSELGREREYHSSLEKSGEDRLRNLETLERNSREGRELLQGTGNEVQRLKEQNKRFAELLDEVRKTKQDSKN